MSDTDRTRGTGELVFHESFDSVRARSGDPDVDPNLAQVQAEALLTLLLGRSVMLNNSLAFDSRSALYFLNTLFTSARRAGVDEKLIREVSPVALRIHAQPTLTLGCVDQLNRLTPGRRFHLSAWQHITNDDRERQEFAAILARLDEADEAARPALLDVPELPMELPSFIGDVPLALEQLRTLRMFNAYLRVVPGAWGPTVRTTTSVVGWITTMRTMGRDAFLGFAREQECPEDYARTIFEAIDRRAKATRTEEVNRTWAHGDELEQELGDDTDLVKEFTDTLQNVQLARSAGATRSYLSTPPRSSNVVKLAQVNRLALAWTEWDGDTATGSAGEDEQEQDQAPMSGVFDTVGTARDLNVRPLGTIYEAYWSLMQDADGRRGWRNSSNRVNSLLRSGDGSERWRIRFAEAWAAHIALLQDRIGSGVVIVGDQLRVEGAQGEYAVVQTNTPGGLAWNGLGEADAAGEYLDMLVQAAR